MINQVLSEADQKMAKSVEATREEFAAIRAGRVNPGMFAKIVANYYGTPTPLQALTEERRKEYVKVVRGKSEDGRVSVRNIRRTAKQSLEKLEKDGDVGKDDVAGAEKRLDAATKKHTDAIDEMLKNKEAELLEV